LGNECVVNTKAVVGIFDLETSTINKSTRKLLSIFQKNNDVVNVSEEMPKSFVLCSDEKKQTVYISNISSVTLQKRYLKGMII